MQVLVLNQHHKFQGKVKCSHCKSKLLLNHEDVFVCSYEVPPWYPDRGQIIDYPAFECSACGRETELKFKFWEKKDYSFRSKRSSGIITEFNPVSKIGFLIENTSYGNVMRRQVPFKLDQDLYLEVGQIVEVSSFCGSRAWDIRPPERSYFRHTSVEKKGEKTFILQE